MPVSICTDSAASLPADLVARHRITVVPMSLTVAGQTCRDGDLALAEVLDRLDEGVTTSGPSPGQFVEALEGVAGPDGAIVLTVAATMSSTHAAAVLAADKLAAPVRVLDTGTAAGGEGLVVLAAAEAAAAGATLDGVEHVARAVAGRVRLLATLENLDRLAASGRVPGAAAWAGRSLGLHPVFEFRDGRARPARPARGRPAAFNRILNVWRRSKDAEGPDARLHVAGLHTLLPEPAEELLSAVAAEVEPADAFIAPFTPVMVAHTGPGLAGLAWWWERPGFLAEAAGTTGGGQTAGR